MTSLLAAFRSVPAEFHAALSRAALLGLLLAGCRPIVNWTDREVADAIAERQRTALAYNAPARVPTDNDVLAGPDRGAYARHPNPRSTGIPAGFEGTVDSGGEPATQPGVNSLPTSTAPAAAPGPNTAPATTAPSTARGPASVPSTVATLPAAAGLATTQATQPGGHIFTLTDALAYAQEHQRAFETAKEDLYLAALNLTLERHLWTPVFASNLRTVYGNFGELQKFDQAMRFVADLSASQRLPYGGEFTAKAVSTLVRDVKRTLTAEEGSNVELGLKVPFLRGAGHVAQEQLILLERELTYAVRAFERFRRQQLVDVARDYFDLLRAKQLVLDNDLSLQRFIDDFVRARDFEAAGVGTLLDAQRAEQQVLFAQNRLETSREFFRAQADQFKLSIGMPVDAPLDLENLEDIESIEKQIAEGRYPLLLRPAAVEQEQRALQVALENRLDLLNRLDQIDDARRGVAVARNGLLPDLDWSSTVTWNTDPAHYRLGDFSFERTTWRSELVLGLPLERTKERVDLRTSLIDVRRAQRSQQELVEGIRAEVRSAANQILLQERSLEIQRRNLAVAERRREFARIQYRDGDIGNRDLFEAEDGWTSARNALNQAKTSRWSWVLQFRLATETLRIDEQGVQQPAPELPDRAD